MDWNRAEKAELVLHILESWINKHKPQCAESIYQVDGINESLPELVIELCEQVEFKSDLET